MVEGRTYETNASRVPLRFKREYMTTLTQVALTLMLYNPRPHNHTYSIPVDFSYLLYLIFDDMEVDTTQIVSNEIKMIVESGRQLGNKSTCPLAFPRLTMGLCRNA